jgi:integrase
MARSQKVVTLPVAGAAEQPDQNKHKRVVACSQAAINALARDGREYSVAGVPGLLVRPGPRKISYLLVRRVAGRLVKVTLAAESLAQARIEAARRWAELRPKAASKAPTLQEAFDLYLESKRLAPSSVALYRKVARLYLLPEFGSRRLDSLSMDRGALHAHFMRIEREHGRGAAASASRLFRAVYALSAKLYDVPPDPIRSYETPRLAARDWSLSPEELQRWWQEVKKMPPVRRTFLLCALLSGARCSSVLNLKWSDLDFGTGVMTFKVAKGRPYSVPMSDRLRRVLEDYRRNGWPENEADLLFPSPLAHGKPQIGLRNQNPLRGIHSLRHTFRSFLARCGAPVEISMFLLGHAFSGAVTFGYVTTSVLLKPAREYANKLAEEFARICGFDDAE